MKSVLEKLVLEKSAESRPSPDFAAHFSSQLLGCTAELQTIGRILQALDKGHLISRSSPEARIPAEVLTSLYRVVGQLRRLSHTALSLGGGLDSDGLFSLGRLKLERVIEEVIEEFRLQGANGRLEFRCRTNRSQVWWSKQEQLKMVLDRLINPLLRYGRPHSRLTITLEEHHGYLERDNGYLLVSLTNPDSFIQSAEVDQLFENSNRAQLFDRLSACLSLYASRKLIEFHGGQLEAEATANGGLTVWFTLPQVEAN